MLAALWYGLPARAQAQIYSWHDANGNLVLSDQRTGPVERSYRVPKAESIRATRPASADRNRFDDLITEHARINQVRPDLVRAVMQVESGFNPSARSPKGALGLMQLMPATIQQFGVRNPFSPSENVRAASRIFASCWTGTRTTSSWRSLPTTPAPEPSTGMDRACRPIGKRATI